MMGKFQCSVGVFCERKSEEKRKEKKKKCTLVRYGISDVGVWVGWSRFRPLRAKTKVMVANGPLKFWL